MCVCVCVCVCVCDENGEKTLFINITDEVNSLFRSSSIKIQEIL